MRASKSKIILTHKWSVPNLVFIAPILSMIKKNITN